MPYTNVRRSLYIQICLSVCTSDIICSIHLFIANYLVGIFNTIVHVFFFAALFQLNSFQIQNYRIEIDVDKRMNLLL